MPRVSIAVVILMTLVCAACTPSRAPSTPSSAGANPPSATQPSSNAPKSVIIGILREPVSLVTDVTGGNVSGGGANQVQYVAHDFLTVQDERGAWQPRLAAEPLSVERGTWVVNPDGTMDTTWKLRPNIKWQDGTPFTSADLQFAYEVLKDPEIPNPSQQATALMASASAPSPDTLVVHWSGPYIRAVEAIGLTPLPRHLLEQTYREDKASFIASPRFTTDFIGLGAYRLVRWQPGIEIQFERYADYFLGRPPLDTVAVRFLSDPNTMVANILSGGIDVAPIGLDIDAAAELKRRWEGTGNQVAFFPRENLRFIEIQFRPEYALPRNALPNRSVRAGLYHVTDRQGLNEVLALGLGAPADSWVRPNHESRAQLESAIPQYPYDQARAQQLLAEGGWTKGSDGVAVHQASGERLEIQLWTQQSARAEKELNVIADGWESVGARVERLIIPAALSGDREYRSKLPGLGTTGTSPDAIKTDRYHSKSITNSANRWVGNNRGGYLNPQADALIERFVVTIDERERANRERDLLQLLIGDVALMPLIWEVESVAMLRGISGPASNGGVSTWNMYQWDRQPA
jgi:peptide/nickel transport system substrate-binding protein